MEAAPVAQLQLELKYGPNGERLIRHIRRVSSPGRRVYSRSALLRPVLGGLALITAAAGLAARVASADHDPLDIAAGAGLGAVVARVMRRRRRRRS